MIYLIWHPDDGALIIIPCHRVVGANGSSTDLVMSTMFFTGTATSTVSSNVYEELKNNNDVKEVVPFATGDNYKGRLIVGTENVFLANKSLRNGE